MNNSMNFTLFNRVKPQPKQEGPPPLWDAALEVSRDVEETVVFKAPAARRRTDFLLRPPPLPHVAVGARTPA